MVPWLPRSRPGFFWFLSDDPTFAVLGACSTQPGDSVPEGSVNRAGVINGGRFTYTRYTGEGPLTYMGERSAGWRSAGWWLSRRRVAGWGLRQRLLAVLGPEPGWRLCQQLSLAATGGWCWGPAGASRQRQRRRRRALAAPRDGVPAQLPTPCRTCAAPAWRLQATTSLGSVWIQTTSQVCMGSAGWVQIPCYLQSSGGGLGWHAAFSWATPVTAAGCACPCRAGAYRAIVAVQVGLLVGAAAPAGRWWWWLPGARWGIR